VANKYSPTTIVAPITSQTQLASMPTHVLVSQECGLKKDGLILLEQIRVIDKKILIEKVGDANNSIMERVN
jgi:mRNA interferase MazF